MIRRSPCSVALTGSWSFVVWWRRRDACTAGRSASDRARRTAGGSLRELLDGFADAHLAGPDGRPRVTGECWFDVGRLVSGRAHVGEINGLLFVSGLSKPAAPQSKHSAISAALIAPSRPRPRPSQVDNGGKPARQATHHRPTDGDTRVSHPVNSTGRCSPTIPAPVAAIGPTVATNCSIHGCSGTADRDRVGNTGGPRQRQLRFSDQCQGPGQRCEPALRRPGGTRPHKACKGGAAVDEHGHR